MTKPMTNPKLKKSLRTEYLLLSTKWLAVMICSAMQSAGSAEPVAPTTETYFPKAEKEGGWRSLVKANEAATVEQKARVRELAGLDWDRLNEAWQYSKSFGGPSSMVVVRRGWIAGEWFTDTNKRGIASCTKSLTALSVAKLCELSEAGRFQKTVSFDEPAWKYLPSAWSEKEPRRKAILLRHMLTMSSGLDPYDGPYSDLQAYGDIILTRHVEAEPGKVWAYASAPIDLLSLVVQDVSGQVMGDFFNEQIGGPIGCAAVEFPKFREYSGGSGGPQGGVRVATRDLARIGYLLLHDGQWRDDTGDKQVFSRETVRRVTRWAPELEAATCRPVQLGSPGKEGAQLDYGHLFWTNRTQVRLGKAVPADAFYMSGWGKQICCVIPSLDMVIVRLGPKRELNDVQDYYAEFLSRVVSGVERE
jgi:CubicO group peptidase (beta-lactamase class C family)